MTDLTWTFVWLAILGSGVAGCVVVRALGVPSTYVRDLLHVGAGVWVLGWSGWDASAPAIAIVAGVVVAVALVPAAARHISLAARFQRSVSGGDEGWTGLVLYTLSFSALTAIGLGGAPFPAAAGLLALSLGDGLGGAVGRRFGRWRFRTWGKAKSFEGSAAVAAGATAGVLVAAALFDTDVPPTTVLVLGAIAAVVEGFAPRSTDNLLVPAAVATAAALLV